MFGTREATVRVCTLATSFPRWRGDHAGLFIFELVRHLAFVGAQVTVVAPRGRLPNGDTTPQRETWDGVRVERFPYCFPRGEVLAYGSGIPANLRRQPVRSLALAPGFLLGFARAIRRVGRDCDLLHANWAVSGLVARAALRGKPLVLTVRGSDVNRFPEAGFMGRLVTRAMRQADRVVAVSQPLAECVVERGVAPDSVCAIRNGVALPKDLRRHSGPGLHVLWVGRLTEEKDVPTLVEAFRRVHQVDPRAKLSLVGDGDQRPVVERLVAEARLVEHVHLLGAQPSHCVSDHYARADLCVLSSVSEGLPNVVLEAMAHGLPVVATAVGGVPDVVEHEATGLLVAPGDPQALADAMLRLVRDAGLRGRLGRAARRGVEPMSWQHAAERYLEVFERTLASRS